MTILIADDQPAVLAALQLLFELDGLPVALARSPQEARERVAQGDVRLVLQDMNFAATETDGRGGAALFRELRRAAPVILMTSWPSKAMGDELLREGAVAYVGKPWDDDELLRLVRAQLDR